MVKFIFTTLLLFTLISIDSLAQKKPNVLVILTDDQGYMDLGSYGATDLKTPHIDRLAETGVRLTQFYAAAPVCSPLVPPC